MCVASTDNCVCNANLHLWAGIPYLERHQDVSRWSASYSSMKYTNNFFPRKNKPLILKSCRLRVHSVMLALLFMWSDIWTVSYFELRVWNQVSYDHRSYDRNLSNWLERRTGTARSRVQTSLKSWLFQASVRNCVNFDHNCDDHSWLDCFSYWLMKHSSLFPEGFLLYTHKLNLLLYNVLLYNVLQYFAN